MTKTIPLLMTVTLFFVAPARSQEAPPSNYEHLKEYGEAIVGRWAGEFEADFEYPPLVKKGDTIRFEVVSEWALEKNVISSKWTAEVNGVAVAQGLGMTGWDRAAERIIRTGFGSLGGHGSAVIEKRGDKWYISGMGVGPDGRAGAGTEIISFRDDDTHEILQIGRLSLQGEPLPDQKVTYKRIP